MADNTIANAIKFLKGEEKSLPTTKTEGQVYFAYKNVGTAEKPSYTGAIYIDTPIGGTQTRIKMTANADVADKAFNDASGLSIRDTYLSSLGYTDDGKQTILIKGSGNNQTRVALPIASTTKSGIVTADAQSFGGTKTFATINSNNLTITGSAGFNYSGIDSGTVDVARPVWFADNSTNGKPVVNTNFTYNPATQTLSVANLSGTADKANKDNAGYDIRSTYISNITVNGTTLTFTKGSGATSSITLQDNNNAVTQTAIKSSDYTNWRTVLWGASNSAIEGFAPTTVTDGAFTSDTLIFQPSSGTLKAKIFKGNLSGNATTATNADKATNDSSGQSIRSTYISSVEVDKDNKYKYNFKTPTGAIRNSITIYDEFQKRSNVDATTDWNTLTSTGIYKVQMSAWGDATKMHSPNSYNKDLYSFGILLVFESIANDSEKRFTQIYIPHSESISISSSAYKRMHNGSDITTGWQSWHPIARGLYWNEISGKPNYAGSSSAGGAATSANKLNTNAGSNTRPVYFSNGIPVMCDTTIANNISGNAATASQLATARTITLDGLSRGSVSFNGSGDVKITDIGYGCTKYVTQSTTTKPYYRIAYYSSNVSWKDASIVFSIDSGYSNGGFGIIKIAFRNNDITTANQSSCEVKWLVREGFDVNQIFVKGNAPAGGDQYADLYFKATGQYQAVTIRVLSSVTDRGSIGRTWTFEEGVPRANADIRKYSYTNEASDVGIVKSSDNSYRLSTARTITLSGAVTGSVSFDGSTNVTLATAVNHTHNQYYDSGLSRTANTVLAAPNGSAGGAIFRKLVAADIPTLTKSKISDFPTSMPASDVYAWAKASTKPSYSWGEITGKPSTFPPSSHTHNYLPLSGGTMNGTAFISWADTGNWGNNNSGVKFPVNRGGLQWSGQSDGVSLYAVETANDNLELYLKFTDDNSNGLSIINSTGSQTARITSSGAISGTSFTGPLNGNAASATTISSMTPTLSTGIEKSAITVKTNDNAVFPIANVAKMGSIRTAIDFQWYDSNWQIGNIRGDSVDSVGFGFAFKPSASGALALKSYIDTNGAYHGNVSGNAATATKLATARTISLTGSVTGSGTFDGSGNLSITTSTNHSHSQYLPLAGGTMTGTINFNGDTLACNFRSNNGNLASGIMHQTYGTEALVFATTNTATSFIFKCGQKPTSMTNNTWTNITPSMMIKNQSVYINYSVANGKAPMYNFCVNGTTRCRGTLGVGDGSSAEIDFFPSGSSTIKAKIKAYSDRIEFVFT